MEQGRADTRHAPELESALYRLVQEALTNVVKHAGAGRVTVALSEDAATIQLSVTDDGAGFQADAASASASRSVSRTCSVSCHGS